MQSQKTQTERMLKYRLLNNSILFPRKLFEQIFDTYNIGDSYQIDRKKKKIKKIVIKTIK